MNTQSKRAARIRLLGAGMVVAALLSSPSSVLSAISMPMQFTHLSVNDGLSQNNVQAILQDSQGYMWFATESGLNRYDGHTITQYHRSRNTPEGLTNDFIWTVVEDEHRNLWLATKGGGVVRWNRDTNTFTSFRHDPSDEESLSSDEVRTIALNPDGTIWAGTRDAGLNLLDPRTGKVQRFRHDPDNARSLGDDRIFALLRDSKGNVWIGTDLGLNRLLPGSTIFQRYRQDAARPQSLSADRVRSIYEDSAGSIWVGTADGGLNRLRSVAGEFTHYRHDVDDPTSLSNDHVRVIYEDASKRLWIGTASGLNLLQRDENNFKRYTHEAGDLRSINDNYVNSIYQDRSGMLWVGTRSAGVSKWNPRSWSLGPYAQPWLSGVDVTAFASDGQGTVWVGTRGAGLARLDESTGELFRYREREGASRISDDRVMSLLIDSRGVLWIGTMGNGLNSLDTGTGEIRSYRHDPNQPGSLSGNGVMTIHEDRSGRIWVGTYGAGVSLYDPRTDRFSHFRHDPNDTASLSDDRASAIVETGDGSVWIGTFGGGVNVLDPQSGKFRRYAADRFDIGSLSEDMVYAIHEDAAGDIWIGTAGGGLDRVIRQADGGVAFENMSRDDELPSNDIYGIQSDSSGHLWLSTNFGLARLNPLDGTVKTFHRSHGLHAEEFNYGAHHRGPDGKLYFGGAAGFNAFLPELVEASQYSPPIVLTSLSVDGRDAEHHGLLDNLDGISLDHRNRVLGLGFAALDYTAPAHHAYEYKIDGIQGEWIQLGNRRHMTFPDLAAGSYRLRVRATTRYDGAPSAEFVMPITKAPAPWASTAAYTTYSAIAILILLFVWHWYRGRLQREVAYGQRLERDVADRTRELKERNRELEIATSAKSEFLARMSHEIRTPMNGMLGMTQLLIGTTLDSKQRRYAQTIRSSSESLLEVINDILDFSKIEAGRLELQHQKFNVSELVEEAADLFAVSAAEKGLEIVCSTPPGPALEMYGDAARLKQVLINLLANAVKFTQDGEILVRFSVIDEVAHRSTLRFEVVDTGIGIKQENQQAIFESFAQEDGSTTRRFGGSGLGLAICRQLVELMDGEIGVDSRHGEGSRFWFTVSLDAGDTVEHERDIRDEVGGLRALVLDDNRTSNSVICGYLSALGIEPTQVFTADNALRQLHAASFGQAFDLLLIDAELKGHDCLEVVRTLRRNPALKSTQIIIMGSSVVADDDLRWSKAGVRAFVSKPIRQGSLIDAIAMAIGLGDITVRTRYLPPAPGNGMDRLGGRVLLVEDNPVNQTVAVGILEEFGCDTVVAINGEEAVSKMSTGEFDIVLMDCELPVMDGFAATAAIREKVASARTVPIIAVTANAIDGDRERCLAAGMQDYLPKPITVEKLHGTLSRWLKAESQESGEEPLDRSSLENIRNLQGVGGDAMVRRVVNIYLSSSVEQLDNLRQAVKESNAEAVRQAAHALKSSSQNVGAKPLSQLCQQLEELGRNGELIGSHALLENIEAAFNDAVDALRKLIGAREH